MLLAVIAVLLLCYVFENRLTPAEQKAIARSEYDCLAIFGWTAHFGT